MQGYLIWAETILREDVIYDAFLFAIIFQLDSNYINRVLETGIRDWMDFEGVGGEAGHSHTLVVPEVGD